MFSPDQYDVFDDTSSSIPTSDSERQIVWDALCMPQGALGSVKWTLYTFIAGVYLLGIVYYTLSHQCVARYLRNYMRILSKDNTGARRHRTLRAVLATLSVSLMWWCLARFVLFRRAFKKRAGISNKDYEWSYGQILSLASWVPVLVELAYLWWEGARAGLTGQLMEPYEVKEMGVEAVDERRDDEMELLARGQGQDLNSRVDVDHEIG
jgi:hypothetical protein